MKKVIAWLLVLALTAALAVGGTLAYLTDTDEDVNVMTIGKVKIDQLEYERIDTETADQNATVQEFHDNKPLYPAVTDKGFDYTPGDTYVDWKQIGKDGYTSDIWDPSKINNEIDKMVFVKNKGDYDAYVRSVFAFEAGKYTTLDEFQSMVHLNLNESDWAWDWNQTPVTIGESTYFVATATYNKVLEPGALTEISLSQIALDKTATNADVEAFGETYQVLVKTQAIQADGFDDPDTALNEGFGDDIPFENDNPIKGIDLRTALHYYEGNQNNQITTKVTNVIYALNSEYPEIIDAYDGTLVDIEQDVPVYAYYVPNGSNYDVYVLANDTIYSPANSKSLYANMTALKTVDTHNYDVSRVLNMESLFDYCGALTTVDTSDWDTSKVTKMPYAFYGCKNLTALDVSGWDMGNVKNMNMTFYGCSKLTELNVSDWDVSSVTNFSSTFCNCSGLTAMDTTDWDVSSATNMAFMFQGCSNLKTMDVSQWDVSNVQRLNQTFYNCVALGNLDVSRWDTSSVTDMFWTFAMCGSLTELDVSGWDTGNVTRMNAMFMGCVNLEELDVSEWDVSKVTSFETMFKDPAQNNGGMKLKNLDVSKWDTGSATEMQAMFYGCGSLTSLDMSNWDVSKVTNMSHMFADCYNLAEIKMDNWKTSSLLSMDAIFNNCGSVKVLDLSSFETSTVKEFSQMFDACYALEEIIGLEDWDTSSGITFEEMFSGCHALKELDLSSFDTSSAYDGYTTINGDKDYRGFRYMFSSVNSLQKLVLGEKFSFDGNGSAASVSFPAPSSIEGSDGKWYDAETGVGYLPSEIPEGVTATYVAVKPVNP